MQPASCQAAGVFSNGLYFSKSSSTLSMVTLLGIICLSFESFCLTDHFLRAIRKLFISFFKWGKNLMIAVRYRLIASSFSSSRS